MSEILRWISLHWIGLLIFFIALVQAIVLNWIVWRQDVQEEVLRKIIASLKGTQLELIDHTDKKDHNA